MKTKTIKKLKTVAAWLMFAAVCGAFEYFAITQPIIYGG